MLEKKHTVSEMKNALDGLISRTGMAEEKSSELKDMSVKFPELKSKEKKKV